MQCSKFNECYVWLLSVYMHVDFTFFDRCIVLDDFSFSVNQHLDLVVFLFFVLNVVISLENQPIIQILTNNNIGLFSTMYVIDMYVQCR